MSIERVAREAGVGKTSIYRRFPSKAELAVGAFASFFPNQSTLPFGDDVSSSLMAMMRQSHSILVSGPGLSLIGTLLAEERRRPELMEMFQRRVFEPRRVHTKEILGRAEKAGEIRSDIDPAAAIDALIGMIIARRLSGEPEPPNWIEQVVDLILYGLAPR